MTVSVHGFNASSACPFAGVDDVLPYIGVLFSEGVIVAAALPHGFTIYFVVFAFTLIYEEFESRVIIPHIYGWALRFPSSVILLVLLMGSVLLGIVGAPLALPVAGLRVKK